MMVGDPALNQFFDSRYSVYVEVAVSYSWDLALNHLHSITIL